MKKTLVLIAAFSLLMQAKIIKVPADHGTIQAAVNASVHGDTVVVSPGTYFENVIFRGKKIVLTSRYYETRDVSFITSTIINGSQPVHPDTASCVLIINGEDSTAVLQGFTLTGGKGTLWTDEHGAGLYREGGGVLTALSSPVIRNNKIINNEVNNGAGGVSAGGGGIRAGDGSPKILQNVIMLNKAMYGGGIVLNYSKGAAVKNNIIYENKVENYISGGQTYGGGGLWINNKLSASSAANEILNNTFYLNFSVDIGGGVAGAGAAILLWNGSKSVVKNNLMWENHFAHQLGPVAVVGSTATIEYNSTMNNIGGTNNIIVEPLFGDSSFIVLQNSPTVDAGDPSVQYNDQENPSIPGAAKFPSRGLLRNDLGAYGGPDAVMFPAFNLPILFLPMQVGAFGVVQPGSSKSITLSYWNHGTALLKVDSIRLRGSNLALLSMSNAAPKQYSIIQYDTVNITWNPSAPSTLNDTLLIYHNDNTKINPAVIVLTGRSFTIAAAQAGTMYAFSGSADGGKMYTVDTSNGLPAFQGATDYSYVISARIDPKSKEIIALASSGAGNKLIRVSSSGAVNLPLSSVATANVKGMAFGPNGSLYLCSYLGLMYTVNLTTGAATAAGNTGGQKVSGLAFNPVNGTLWASVRPVSAGFDNIYKIDRASNTASLVGATGFGVVTKDITFDSKGRMFGVIDTAGSQSYLISIDTTTGKGRVIGAMGVKGIETIELQSAFITAVGDAENAAPQTFGLEQNFPNPFNPSTTITYSLGEHRPVTLTIHDLLGKEITTLVNSVQSSGTYTVRLNGSTLSSGIYFYTLRAGSFTQTKKLTLIK